MLPVRLNTIHGGVHRGRVIARELVVWASALKTKARQFGSVGPCNTLQR